MKKRTKIILLSCIIFSILIGILYVSYGFFTSNIEGNESAKKAVYNSQILKVEFSDGTETLTTNQDGYFTPGAKLEKTFTVTNTGNVPVKYSINLTDITNDFERKEDITYELASDGNILYENLKEVKGVFPDNNKPILSYDLLEVGAKKTYTLTINYLNSEENQIIDSGKTINAKVTINENLKSVANLIVKGNSVRNTPNLVPSGITTTTGSYLNSSGELVSSSSNWAFTDYISVDGYAFTLKIPSGIAPSVCAYDENQTLIKCVNYNSKTSVSISSNTLIKYIRYSYPTSNGLSATSLRENISLDNPVEVESVGNKSSNLLDPSSLNPKNVSSSENFEATNTGFKLTNSGLSTGYYESQVYDITSLVKPNGTYYFHRDIERNWTMTVTNNGAYLLVGAIRVYVDGALYKNAYSNVATTSFTLPESFTSVVIKTYSIHSGLINLDGSAADASIDYYMKWNNVYLGEEPYTEYEPYNKYIVPITVSSKNVFDENADFSNNIVANTNNYQNYEMQLKPNTTYTVTVNENTQTRYIVISIGKYYNGSGSSEVWISHRTQESLTLKPGKTVKFTTTSNGLIYLCISMGDPLYFKSELDKGIKGLQIEEGTVATEYSPYKETKTYNIYLDEPLRKVGSSSDYIDFNTKKLVRKVADVDLSAAYNKFTGVQTNVSIYKNLTDVVRFGNYTVSLGLKKGIKNSSMLSNVWANYKTDWTTNRESIFFHSDLSEHFYTSFKKSRLGITSESTDTEIKTLMSDYVKNNDIKIYYELGSSSSSDIDLPVIDIDTNSVVTIGTDVAGSVEVEYNE